jgi:ABC-type dipeptide/oligopeptide/nickel transport system permease component
MIRQLPVRLVSLALAALLGAFVTFLLGYYGPGDPVRNILGLDFGTAHEAAALKHTYGLDRPVPVQFADYVWSALHGDLGQSWQRGRPVSMLVTQGLEITLQLAAASIFVMVVIGIPLGVIAALNHNRLADRGIVITFIVLHAIPPYVLGPLLLVIGVLWLDLVPVTVGWQGLFSTTTIIPVLTLVLGPLVFIIRQTRNSVLEVLGEQHILTAEALGLPTRVVLVRHLLPNAIGPVISQLGLAVGGLLAATVFVESIFNIPGYGSLLFGSVQTQDYPLLVGSTMVAIVFMSLVFLVTDLVQALFDPRITWR